MPSYNALHKQIVYLQPTVILKSNAAIIDLFKFLIEWALPGCCLIILCVNLHSKTYTEQLSCQFVCKLVGNLHNEQKVERTVTLIIIV